MEGIILFADDNIYTEGFEKDFFTTLIEEDRYPVIAVDTIDRLTRAVKSVSTFKAIIVDWNFKRKEKDLEDLEESGAALPDDNPDKFLLSTKLFSLIYIYSDADIENSDIGTELRKKYGDRIKFKKKNKDNNVAEEKKAILSDIEAFEKQNPSLVVPYVWSQSINESVQQIFSELQSADPNWIKEIYTTAENDGMEPNAEVIGVFQHLLAELIVQDKSLIENITGTSKQESIKVENKEISLSQLYHRLYYTKLANDAPIMTGDIFQIDSDTAAILITPECDVRNKKEKLMEFLVTRKNDFRSYLHKTCGFEIGKTELDNKKRDRLYKVFNQDDLKIHVLPSFPFDNNSTALINFQTGLAQIPATEFVKFTRNYKINSPYVHQLRQRYLAYIGRVGVPAMPSSLREHNLK